MRVNALSAESSPKLTWDAMGLRADSARNPIAANVNPRPYKGGGGVGATPPLRFSRIAKNGGAPPGLGYLMGQILRNFGKKKFDRVRSGHGAMTS